jgi:hypothetical protein
MRQQLQVLHRALDVDGRENITVPEKHEEAVIRKKQ